MTNGFAFHGGLFREGFRRLRTVGLILLVLFTIFDMNYTFSYSGNDYFPSYMFSDIFELHPTLIFAPFIPILLTLWAFSFQNSRKDSDFYHSLPVTKFGISTSFLLATMAWNAIIIVGSSLIVLLSYVAYIPENCDFFREIIVPVAGAFVGSMMTTAITFLALTLTGNSITALAMTSLFLFGPRLMITSVLQTAIEKAEVYPMDRLYLLFDAYPEGLLYSSYDSITAWIGGFVITIVAFSIGLWLCRRRQSETAGHASVSPAVQVLARLVFTMICSLPAILIIHEWLVDLRFFDELYGLYINTLNLGTVVFLYVLVAVAHSLFELITTKSVKKMVRSFPWLGIVAALNAVIIAAACTVTFSIRDFTPTADEINSVCVRDLSASYHSYDSDFNHIQSEYSRLCFYYDYDELKLTDIDARQAVSKALSDAVRHQTVNVAFWVDVCIYTDSGSHERRIEMSKEQVSTLFKAMHEQYPFDSYYLENYVINT